MPDILPVGLWNSPEGGADHARMRERIARVHAEFARHLPGWTVHGPGYAPAPGAYCARLFLRWPMPVETNLIVRAGSLEALRDLMPPGLRRAVHQDGEEPDVIERWVTLDAEPPP